MITVDAFDAQRLFSTLLDRAVSGEDVLITRRGTLVARLVGERRFVDARVRVAFDRLIALRKGTTLGGLLSKALRDSGRR